jgi:hypothetical protein
MGSPNGGIIGVINPTSFGKCTVTTVTTSSGPLTTQPGTRIVADCIYSMQVEVVLLGAAGSGGGGAGGYFCTLSHHVTVCGATAFPIIMGGGGAGAPSGCTLCRNSRNSFFKFVELSGTSTGGGGRSRNFRITLRKSGGSRWIWWWSLEEMCRNRWFRNNSPQGNHHGGATSSRTRRKWSWRWQEQDASWFNWRH